jgi:hypothetical protein
MEQFCEYKDCFSPGQLGYFGEGLAAEGGLCASPVAGARPGYRACFKTFSSERNIIETR